MGQGPEGDYDPLYNREDADYFDAHGHNSPGYIAEGLLYLAAGCTVAFVVFPLAIYEAAELVHEKFPDIAFVANFLRSVAELELGQ